MIKKVNHVAIAVKNLDEGLKVFENLLGHKAAHVKEVPDQKIKAAMIHVGDVEIELIQPTDPGTGVAKFLEGKGEGVASSTDQEILIFLKELEDGTTTTTDESVNQAGN